MWLVQYLQLPMVAPSSRLLNLRQSCWLTAIVVCAGLCPTLVHNFLHIKEKIFKHLTLASSFLVCHLAVQVRLLPSQPQLLSTLT